MWGNTLPPSVERPALFPPPLPLPVWYPLLASQSAPARQRPSRGPGSLNRPQAADRLPKYTDRTQNRTNPLRRNE